MRMVDKVCVVTGAASGLGAATAKRLAEEGGYVYVTDINTDQAHVVASEIVAAGGKAVAKALDVTAEDDWEVFMGELLESHGKLDVLVNNAGILISDGVEECTIDDWRTVHKVNLESVFLGSRAAIRVMKSRGGSIINMSSLTGLVGFPGTAAYSSSKGGVRLLTKTTAIECAEKGYNIRVNSVHPGVMLTPMYEGSDQELQDRITAAIPLRRMGAALDVANGCLFLASDEANYITGIELPIDGGYTCQ